jgi:hypothetical protein
MKCRLFGCGESAGAVFRHDPNVPGNAPVFAPACPLHEADYETSLGWRRALPDEELLTLVHES